MNRLSAIGALGSTLAVIALSVAAGCHNSGNEKNAASHSDTTYTLTGNIQGLDSQWIYLVHLQAENNNIDSVRAGNGRFVFTGRATAPENCLLVIPTDAGNPFRTDLFLENGELTVTGKKDSLSDVVVTGPPQEEELKRFMTGERPLALENNAAYYAYQVATAQKDRKTMDSLEQVLIGINQQLRRSIKDYAIAHPSSYTAAFEVDQNFAYNPDPYQMDSVYKGMDSAVRASFYGRKVRATLDKVMRTAIGRPAPDFTLPDIHDRPVLLASFKGRVTLVDFWASWCVPCRAENPNVVKAYHKYHSKGFAILGVSLDDQKDKWIKAIKQDKLAWTHVSDLQGWHSSVAALYGVEGIPMNFLLDKEGKIVGKGLRGKELEKKLEEVLK